MSPEQGALLLFVLAPAIVLGAAAILILTGEKDET